MMDIKKWMNTFLNAVNATFTNRIWFVGLQGSYGRGEATETRVYFDENCEYEIVEREITPAKMKCPGCKRTVLHGMDYCNFCGIFLTEENE